jgi:GSH-dependent disulfide-bond oxidoreductase
MITVYTRNTPNGLKIPILMEELGAAYDLHIVDTKGGELDSPEFRAINPNGKLPAILDHGDVEGAAPLAIWESAAIMIHLADKYGGFLAREGQARADALAWLMLQIASVGPTFGQLVYFSKSAPEKLPLAIERFRSEGERLMVLIDAQLTARPWLAGDYSIADIAMFSWLRLSHYAGMPTNGYPALARWLGEIEARPAVIRAIGRVEAAS